MVYEVIFNCSFMFKMKYNAIYIMPTPKNKWNFGLRESCFFLWPAVKAELSPAKAKAQAKRVRLEKTAANRKAAEERICAMQSEKEADASTEAAPKEKAAKEETFAVN